MDAKVYKNFLSKVKHGYAFLEIRKDKNTNYEFVEVNQEFERFIGQSDIIGKNLLDLFSADEQNNTNLYLSLIRAISLLNDEKDKYTGEISGYQVILNKESVNDGEYIFILVQEISEESALRKKLNSTIENYESFFNATDEMFFVGDINGNILFSNKAVENKLGYTENELADMHILELHPVKKRVEAEEIFNDMFQGKRNVCPLPLARKDGSYLPAETRIWFGKWNGEERIFGLSKDLSSEQEALQKFIKLFNRNPACMAITDMSSKEYTQVNNAFLNTFGFTEEEVIGNTAQELEIVIESEKYDQTYKELISRGFFNAQLMKARKKNGDYVNGLFSGEMIESQGKKYLMTVMVDLSEQKSFEAELLKKSQLQNILIDLSSNYINCPLENVDNEIKLSLEKVGRFVGADRVYIFNYDFMAGVTSNTYEWCKSSIQPQIEYLQDVPLDSVPDWVTAHTQGDLISIPDVSVLDGKKTAVKELLEAQGVKSLIALPMMFAHDCIGFVGFDSVKNRRIYSESEIELLRFYAQILVNIHIRIVNERKLKDSRSNAQKANETKNYFIAKVSHELRNPLNGAWGFFNLLNESIQSEKEKDYTEKGLQSLNQVIKIANDLLDISRMEANKLEFSNDIFNINNLMKEAIEPYVTEINKKHIKLDLNVDKNITYKLIGDQNRLKQIIGNLINNAVLHAQADTIEFNCKLNDRGAKSVELLFYVKDNGIGIPNSVMYKIFEPFYKKGNVSLGAGLGLPICKELVERMGGKMWAESYERKGATFYFSLPFCIEQSQSHADLNTHSKKEYSELNGLHVLLAEDDAINQALVKNILSRKGIMVTAVSNGAEVLSTLEDNDYDLILMDIQMPIMDGLEATKTIRKSNNQIPIIALTAAVLPNEKYEYFKYGINDIIEKPIFSDLLFQKIHATRSV